MNKLILKQSICRRKAKKTSYMLQTCYMYLQSPFFSKHSKHSHHTTLSTFSKIYRDDKVVIHKAGAML